MHVLGNFISKTKKNDLKLNLLEVAIIIGNLAKNWNFRFGLSFAQFGTQGRGITGSVLRLEI